MYERAFTEFFSVCKELTGASFNWMYLSGVGAIGVTVDMDTKQMAGKYTCP